MFRTKSLTAKEMITIASNRGHRNESKQNNRSSLRSLIADKTIRYRQHLEKLALNQFNLNSHSYQSPCLGHRTEVEQFITSPSEDPHHVEQLKTPNPIEHTPVSTLNKSIQVKAYNLEESPTCEEYLKEEVTVLKQYCDYLKTENFTYRQEMDNIRNQFMSSKKKKQLTIEELKEELNEQKNKNISLLEQIKNKQLQIEQSQTEKKNIQSMYITAKSQLESIKSLYQEMEDKMTNIQNKKSQLKISDPQINFSFKGKRFNDYQSQTEIEGNHLQKLISEKQELLSLIPTALHNQTIQHQFQYMFEEKLPQKVEPLMAEIALLNELNKEIKCQYEQKIKTYIHLLQEAQKQIQSLLGKLRIAKQNSIEVFKQQLLKQRIIKGISQVENIQK